VLRDSTTLALRRREREPSTPSAFGVLTGKADADLGTPLWQCLTRSRGYELFHSPDRRSEEDTALAPELVESTGNAEPRRRPDITRHQSTNESVALQGQPLTRQNLIPALACADAASILIQTFCSSTRVSAKASMLASRFDLAVENCRVGRPVDVQHASQTTFGA
jgi:hypothetical protein